MRAGKDLREASGRLEEAWINVRVPADARSIRCTSRRLPILLCPAMCVTGLRIDEPSAYWSEQDVSTRIDRIQCSRAAHCGLARHVSWKAQSRTTSRYATVRAANSHGKINTSSPARGSTFLGEIAPATSSFGEAANLPTDEILLRWFNHWLKDSGEFDWRKAHALFLTGPQ